MQSTHNLDRYMVDFRSLISLGSKRIALFLGSGVPASIQILDAKIVDSGGTALIPTVAPMTEIILDRLTGKMPDVVAAAKEGAGEGANIEAILSRARSMGRLLGKHKIGNISGLHYRDLEEEICKAIGEMVAVKLPPGPNPYGELVGWISGTDRTYPLEIFTTNYDLLLEEALELSRAPYFDGFVGSHEPFFDPPSVSNDDLPRRWTKIWKIHGSLGWKMKENRIVRTGESSECALVYPSELKYEESQKLPYQALFDKLRTFLETPDTLLITCGFSFEDSHIASVFEEALAANPAASVFAFQFRKLEAETAACRLALKRANFSAYCSDGAVINCIKGKWALGELPSKNWKFVRPLFWNEGGQNLSLGDFRNFARFFARIKTDIELPSAKETTT